MLLDNIGSQYERNVQILERTGIAIPLPKSRTLGVVGFNGQEYPMPTLSQVQDLVQRNQDLVTRKYAQGFTRLQLTPLSLPIKGLYERVTESVIEEQSSLPLKLINSVDSTDLSVKVYKHPWYGEVPLPPTFLAEDVAGKDETGELVYMPQSFPGGYTTAFDKQPHIGKTKAEIINDPRICPVPGWSIGLIEDIERQSAKPLTLAGRESLPLGLLSQDYYEKMQELPYVGESGWTPEDFLVHFITRLHETHDIDSSLDIWLTGSLIPNAGGLVEQPRAFWSANADLLKIQTISPENFHFDGVARSMVRLPA